MGANIGIGIANAIGFNRNYGKGSIITPLKPIARYSLYDKTNDDSDRDIVKDLTGNGHDIRLYNFEFAEGSGYGKYATDFSKWTSNKVDSKFNNKFTFTKTTGGGQFLMYLPNNPKINSFKIRASGFIENKDILSYRYFKEGVLRTYIIKTNGIHILPATDGTGTIGFLSYNIQSEITIEQIPDYQGALVSDGVDDYGLCENFPILSPEKGFIICAIREHFDADKRKVFRFIDFGFDNYANGVLFECNDGSEKNVNSLYVVSFGIASKYIDYNKGFSYATSINYNGESITKSDKQSIIKNLLLFGNTNKYYSSSALYALEIYDRDLTDEEIAKVKARMIAEYEEKTGNKYEEETV